MSAMKDTILHNPEQLGAAIRLRRKEKGLTQNALAALVGAERKWVLNLESGNSKAEIGLILRAIEVLGLRAALIDRKQPARGPGLKIPRLDLVQHLQRGPRKWVSSTSSSKANSWVASR
jgi:transcriptional regulator with XRE-family HTH domain